MTIALRQILTRLLAGVSQRRIFLYNAFNIITVRPDDFSVLVGNIQMPTHGTINRLVQRIVLRPIVQVKPNLVRLMASRPMG